jgi:hypothetical protein
MRTYKLATILLFQADASDKDEDSGERQNQQGERGDGAGYEGRGGDADDEGCTKQKCNVWFILSQELIAIFCVAFLLLVCLPVLAFWFMFIGILVSSYNIFTLLKRLWRDSHSAVEYLIEDHDDVSIMDELTREGDDDGGNNDIEFQEFMLNFSEGGDKNNNNNSEV